MKKVEIAPIGAGKTHGYYATCVYKNRFGRREIKADFINLSGAWLYEIFFSDQNDSR